MPSEPEKIALEAQMKRILADAGFAKSESACTLLQYLMKELLDGKPTPKGSVVMAELYPQSGSDSGRARRNAMKLRASLKGYYRRKRKAAGSLTIRLARGFKLEFIGRSDSDFSGKLKGKRKSMSATKPSENRDALGLQLFAADSDKAMRKVAARLARVKAVLDTSVRFKPARHYNDGTVGILREAIASYLSRGSTWTGIVGERLDLPYVSGIAGGALASTSPGNCSLCQLKTSHPFLNFMLLEYFDGPPEVLLGWGRYQLTTNETVFSCRSPEFAGIYRDFFNALVHDAGEPMDLGKLAARSRAEHMRQRRRRKRAAI